MAAQNCKMVFRKDVQTMGKWKTCVCILQCLLILTACGKRAPENEDLGQMTSVNGPASCGFGPVEFTIPEGYSIENRESDGEFPVVFREGETAVGGMTRYTAPEDFSISDYFSRGFLEAMGVPEASDDTLGHSGGGSTGGIGPMGWTVEYFSDVPPGEERKVHSFHQFYVLSDNTTIIDIWFDLLVSREDFRVAVLNSISIPEIGREPVVTEEEPAPEAASYPFEFSELPEGYFHDVDAEGNLVFTDGSNTVGGILRYPIPEGDCAPADGILLWLEKMEIPDFEDPTLFYIGGRSTGNGGWLAEFASDVPDKEDRTVYRRHHFYPINGVVYDIWFDRMLISHETSEYLRETVILP